MIVKSVSKNISHTCLIKFNSVYDNLKTAEKKAADFCLTNPEQVKSNTITEVANLSGCSEATLVRLSKRLGYNSYPEFRSSILPGTNEDMFQYVGIASSDNLQTITENVFRSCILYLQDSLQTIDYELLEDAVKMMTKAQRFMFAASGDAQFTAASAAQKFLRIGYQANAFSDFDSQLIALSQMSEDDVLICISHSGRTSNVCSLAKIAQDHGIKVISITNFPKSPLTKHSNLILLTTSFTYDLMDEILAKRVPALCIVDILYISVMLSNNSDAQKRVLLANDYLSLNKN